ncbi:MAG: tRNA (adenosine(37)-N6)-threonylcarbamoyltransferase complex dimerization subunit type 1 TsaB [Bacillota bacterium]|nr:tRNA (adenosine(37)-N6)-threonylcarbamoyltransferase complex dimerization subunit type 1 TsaB [Bacillota bacterium]
MLILACELSGPVVSVSLWQNGQVIAETLRNVGLIHSVTFMPMVAEILQKNGFTPADVTHYAVTTGPGSFTGIRIGISAVKAMAYASEKPVLGFSTLDVLAWPYRNCDKILVCPMIDARNSRAYTAAWLGSKMLISEVNQPVADFCAAVAQLLQSADNIASVLLIGMIPSDEQLVSLRRFAAVTAAPRSNWMPRASSLAEIAADAAARGDVLRPDNLKANYLTVSSAERLRAEKNG